MVPESLDLALGRIGPLDRGAMDRARQRQDTLTKPPGSLGRLPMPGPRASGWPSTRGPDSPPASVATAVTLVASPKERTSPFHLDGSMLGWG